MTVRARAALFGLALLSAAVCSALGVWQLGRLIDRRAANERAVAGRALPEVDLAGESGSGRERAGELDQRRVVATGSWDHANTFVLRARADRDAPGVHIVTPVRLDGRDLANDPVLGFPGFLRLSLSYDQAFGPHALGGMLSRHA